MGLRFSKDARQRDNRNNNPDINRTLKRKQLIEYARKTHCMSICYFSS